MNLEGKRIWLTGASSGIGAALAQQLAASGAALILSARSVDALEAVRLSCAAPQAHRVLALDLADAGALQGLLPALLASVGPFDILIHCAGLGQRASVAETSMDVHRRIMEVNYFAAVALTRAALPQLLQRRQPMIVAVASVMGRISLPRRSAYAASKHALLAFMDALRAELHDTKLKVICVCPGYVSTAFAAHALLGDGSVQGHGDDSRHYSMNAQTCASRIVDAMRRERAEVLIGGKEIYGVYLQRLLPSVYRWLMTRIRVS